MWAILAAMNTTEVVAEMRPEKNSQRKKQLDNE